MYRCLYAYWNEDYWETTRHLPNIKVLDYTIYCIIHILNILEVLKIEIAKVLVTYLTSLARDFFEVKIPGCYNLQRDVVYMFADQ